MDELLGGSVDGRLGVDDGLDGAGPAGRLRQQLGVEAVRVPPPEHRHVPVACGRSTRTRWSPAPDSRPQKETSWGLALGMNSAGSI